MTDVTLTTLLMGEEYTPLPGQTRYEIAEGVWGVLQTPTVSRAKKAQEIAKNPDALLADLMPVILSFEDGVTFTNDDLIINVPVRAQVDFFSMFVNSMPKVPDLSDLSALSDTEMSETPPEPA